MRKLLVRVPMRGELSAVPLTRGYTFTIWPAYQYLITRERSIIVRAFRALGKGG